MTVSKHVESQPSALLSREENQANASLLRFTLMSISPVVIPSILHKIGNTKKDISSSSSLSWCGQVVQGLVGNRCQTLATTVVQVSVFPPQSEEERNRQRQTITLNIKGRVPKKSDISGALGPIHYITLKAFAMASRDGTKCKTCFGDPRMILHAHWKNTYPK